MRDYDFNITKVIKSYDNVNCDTVKVDNEYYNGISIFPGAITIGGEICCHDIKYYDRERTKVNEEATFSKAYLEVLKQRRGGVKTDSSKSEKNSDNRGFVEGVKRILVQIIFTIIPVLPIWWAIKLVAKSGWYGIKCIFSILTWPFRLALSCCCKTNLLPEGGINMPEYWF